MCEIFKPRRDDDLWSGLPPLISCIRKYDIRNFKRLLKKADTTHIDGDLIGALLNLWRSDSEWASPMFSALIENSPISQQALVLKICVSIILTSTFRPQMLHLMRRAGITLVSKEPAADCLRISSLAGATEFMKAILSHVDSPRRRVDSMELQLAHALFKGTASRHELAICLAVRRQHNIIKFQKTQLKRFQNVHPFFTEVEADFLSVIMEKLRRKQDVQVQAILLTEKYFGSDTLQVLEDLAAVLGPIQVEAGSFAKDVLDLAEIVLTNAPDDFVRISNSLNDRALHEYTQDISMYKLSRFLVKVCSSKLLLEEGFTAFVAALLSRSDGSPAKLSQEHQAALYYGAACVHELSCRKNINIDLRLENCKGIDRARRILSSLGRRQFVKKDMLGWRGAETAASLVSQRPLKNVSENDSRCRSRQRQTLEMLEVDDGPLKYTESLKAQSYHSPFIARKSKVNCSLNLKKCKSAYSDSWKSVECERE